MVALADIQPGGTFFDAGQRRCFRLARAEQATKVTVAQKASRHRAFMDAMEPPSAATPTEPPHPTEDQASIAPS